MGLFWNARYIHDYIAKWPILSSNITLWHSDQSRPKSQLQSLPPKPPECSNGRNEHPANLITESALSILQLAIGRSLISPLIRLFKLQIIKLKYIIFELWFHIIYYKLLLKTFQNVKPAVFSRLNYAFRRDFFSFVTQNVFR